MSRKAALSLGLSGANKLLKKLNKLFRMSRGPFHSSKFGKQISDSKAILLKALQNGSLDESVEQQWVHGLARDMNMQPEMCNRQLLISSLEKKTGSWFQNKCN